MKNKTKTMPDMVMFSPYLVRTYNVEHNQWIVGDLIRDGSNEFFIKLKNSVANVDSPYVDKFANAIDYMANPIFERDIVKFNNQEYVVVRSYENKFYLISVVDFNNNNLDAEAIPLKGLKGYISTSKTAHKKPCPDGVMWFKGYSGGLLFEQNTIKSYIPTEKRKLDSTPEEVQKEIFDDLDDEGFYYDEKLQRVIITKKDGGKK